MIRKRKIDVLYIHPSGNQSDYNIPMGLIGLMNSIKCAKIGKMYYEVNDRLISNSKIVVMDCHWYFSLFEIGRLVKNFKKINPKLIIIIGGYTATVFAEMIVDKFKVDYVIRGDAEIPFSFLIKELLEGRDGRRVPNVVNKEFSTPQSYHLTNQEFSKFDYLNINWFPAFKRRMIRVHKSIPFSCYESVGLYPFIMVYKGCRYNCDFCYTKQSLHKKLYKRDLVARSPESIIKDLHFCSKDSNIKQVYILADFVNILDKVYTDKIFSRRYDLNLYYEFEHFNSPPLETLKKMISCFNKCYFSFIFAEPFHKNPKERFEYLKEVMNYFKNSGKEVRVRIYRGNSGKFNKYLNELMQMYERLEFQMCSQWFRPIPFLCKNNDTRGKVRYFNFWLKKSKTDMSKHFIAKSYHDDNYRFNFLAGAKLMLENEYKGAIKKIKTAIQLGLRGYNAHLLLGLCYKKIGQYKRALTELKKVQKNNPGQIGTNFSLSLCYRKIGKIKQGNKELEKVFLKFKNLTKRQFSEGSTYKYS